MPKKFSRPAVINRIFILLFSCERAKAFPLKNMKITIAFIKYVSTFAAFIAVVLLSSMTVGAQTDAPDQFDSEFSVPCAEALRIGLSGVEKIHFKMTKIRNGGESDSETEIVAEQSAAKNYLACRQADTAKKSEKLKAAEKKQINSAGANALRLARMRVDLLYSVSFNESDDDPINYSITQNAIVLVEDFKGKLASVYGQKRDSNALGNAKAAARDEKQIGALLVRIEKVSREHDEEGEFAAFKTAVEKTLAKIKDDVGTEKVVTTAFLVRLLQMNLAD